LSATIALRARDGHAFSAYESRPDGPARGGLVVLQEIFGVTAHLRRVCDDFATHGYHVVAPALYDRIRPGIVLGDSPEEHAAAREFRGKVAWDAVLNDVAAVRDHLSDSGKKVATLGYCWGGTISWRAATQLDGIAAAVCYYATHMKPFVAEKPKCPVLMHFGESDPIATLADAGAVRAAQGAQVEIQVYPAGHGFNRDEIPAFHAPSAALALRRSLDFLSAHIGGARGA
jgi:carboxymethylenebutenolidase